MAQANQHRHIGFVMSVIAWLLVLAFLMFFFYRWHQTKYYPNANLNTQVLHGQSQVILYPNPQNHYIFPGKINQVTVNFLLDTGASHVVVPATLAKRLHLVLGQAVSVQTAAGPITVYQTRIKELAIGSILLKNVKASINPHMKAQEPLLLGMSALKMLHMEQRSDQLVLRSAKNSF